jgi:hypothetical protein
MFLLQGRVVDILVALFVDQARVGDCQEAYVDVVTSRGTSFSTRVDLMRETAQIYSRGEHCTVLTILRLELEMREYPRRPSDSDNLKK